METKRLNDRFHGQVSQYVKEEWLGPMIISRGNAFDSSALPGFTAEEGKAC